MLLSLAFMASAAASCVAILLTRGKQPQQRNKPVTARFSESLIRNMLETGPVFLKVRFVLCAGSLRPLKS
jgi:hypothetical protein